MHWKNICGKGVIMVVALLVSATLAWASGSVWVSSQSASLKDDKTPSAKTLAIFKKDSKLSLLEKDGHWYKVKYNNLTGWIYRGRLTEEEPKATKGKTAGNSVGLFGDLSSDIKADSATTDRAIRGLTPQASQYAQNTGTPLEYRLAMDKVLARKYTAGQLEDFLKRGKVGEYAR